MNGTKPIAAADLFCGVGGLTFGLEMAGIDVRLGVDIDPTCEHPIRENTQARFLHADVATLDPKLIISALGEAEVTLLAGCAPCQPFSTYARAARRENNAILEDGADWRLVSSFGSLVGRIKPDLVTMENVPPLAAQPVFQTFLKQLEGYWIDHRIVECAFLGLPQTRKRLVLVASKLGPIRIPGFDIQRSCVRDAIGNLPAIAAGEEAPEDRLHRASKLSAVNLERIRSSTPGGTWRDWPDTLRSACHSKKSGATYPSVYGRMKWDAPAPTITTQCFGYGNGRFGHPEQDRAISLREAAMLQGFPRQYSFLPDNEPVSFAKLGRLIGNAVPVTLSHAIGTIITEHVRAL
jgi:DNA (cytosine-5)-methyltransferase 1